MSTIIKKIIFQLLIVITVGIFISSQSAFGQTPTPDSTTPTPTPNNSKKDDLNHTIEDLQSKINDLQSQKKTLKSQIEVMDSQIKLTSLRIQARTQEINELKKDIDTTIAKISILEKSLSDLTEVLVNRIVATYQVGSLQTMQVMLSSGGLSDFLTRFNYLKIAQEHDKKLLYETQQAKTDYANQKSIFEAKKQKVEALQAQLEAYTNQLNNEKKDKETLLTVTNNSEQVYQQKLAAALAEYQAIQKISEGFAKAVSVGSVKQGDVVGHVIVGRSACSSGTHLHFEVHNNGGLADPSGYLSNRSVIFENSPDAQFGFNGSWEWPLPDSIRIEQGFGMTYWARTGWYGGGPHTGIDMFSDASVNVRAVKDGELFRGSIACGGGFLQFARVDQSDGIQTYYLHTNP